MATSSNLSRCNGSSCPDRECIRCGGPFVPTNARQVYCSTECGGRARQERFKAKKREGIIQRHIAAMNAELREHGLDSF